MKINFFILFLITMHTSFSAYDNVEIIQLHSDRWKEYKELRIKSVIECPLAFTLLESDLSEKPDSFWRDILNDAALQNNRWLVCAQTEGRLIGMVSAIAENTDSALSKHVVMISNMYVLPEFREKGIATLLMQELLLLLENIPDVSQALLWVTPTQTAAIKLYNRFEFTICGLVPRIIKFEERYYDMYLMERSLKQ